VKVKRNCTVELVVDEETEKRLRQLCDLSSKLWNEVNYARLRMWLEERHIDFNGTYREFYERYKPLIGSATAQTILLRNGKAWKSFFRLLELKKEGRLPPSITRVSPPGYKKKRKSRVLWTIIRKSGGGCRCGRKATSSSRRPWHGDECGIRVYRGLFECTRLNKIFNADLAAAYNILLTPVTPEPRKGEGVMAGDPAKGRTSKRGDVAQTSPLRVEGVGKFLYIPGNTY
jgi:transposase